MSILWLSSWLFTLLFSIWISLLIISTQVQKIFIFLPFILWGLLFLLVINYFFNKIFLKKYNKIPDCKPFWSIVFLLNNYKMSKKYIYLFIIYYYSLIIFCTLIIFTTPIFLWAMSFELNVIPQLLIGPTLLSFPILFFIILFIKIKLYKNLINDLWISKRHLFWLVLLESFYYPVILKIKK